MEEGRKSVLVAALSTYADLLAKSTSELDLGQGKGKSKASDDDVDLEAERLDQLNLCRELVGEVTSGKSVARTSEEKDSSLPGSLNGGGFSRDRHASTTSLRAKRTSMVPKYQFPDEEYTNAFTGLPVVQETGFEPGPSNKPPQPVRNSSWKSAAPNSKGSQHWSKSPAPLPRTASLPISWKPLPEPGSSEHSANNWSSRLSQMSSPYSHSDEVTTSSQSRRDLRTNRGVDQKSPLEAEDPPNPAQNGSYLSRISALTSKALKSAVSILGMNQTQPEYHDPPARVGSFAKVPNKSRDDIQFLMTSPHAAAESRGRRSSSPPPAYDTLSHGPSVAPPPTVVDIRNSKDENKECSNGKATNSALTDDEAFARSLQEEEYREIQRERDMLLALSLANGTADDGDVVLAHFMAREYEDLIASTGATSGAATGGTAHGIQASDSKQPPQFDFSQWDAESRQMQLDHLYALEIEESLRAEELANDVGWAEAMRLQAEYDREEQNHEAWEEYKKTNFAECVVCGDENHREEFLRPCEHGYCEGCLQEGFKNALASKTPLKCCKKNLSVDDCSGLEAEFVIKYQELILELTTPNPMYCCNVQCAKFLPPSAIVGEIGKCGACGTETCKHCRKLVHPGVFCEEDKETKAVKELAMQKGWKMCPGCNHLIERQSGCLHMICSRCQTAFCYRCSKRWNDCESTCPDPLSATHPKYPGRN